MLRGDRWKVCKVLSLPLPYVRKSRTLSTRNRPFFGFLYTFQLFDPFSKPSNFFSLFLNSSKKALYNGSRKVLLSNFIFIIFITGNRFILGYKCFRGMLCFEHLPLACHKPFNINFWKIGEKS